MHNLKLFLCFALLLFLSACGESGPDLSEQVRDQLPEGWDVSEFEVTAKEETGSSVEPGMDFRFRATASPSEDLYQEVTNVNSRPVLKKMVAAGESSPLHGIGRAELKADVWDSNITYEKAPWLNMNMHIRPIGAWEAQSVVIGSPEYEAFVQKMVNGQSERKKQFLEAKAKREKMETELTKLSESHQAEIDSSQAKVDKLRKEFEDILENKRVKAPEKRKELDSQAYNDWIQSSSKRGKEAQERYWAALADHEAFMGERAKEFREKQMSLKQEINAIYKRGRAHARNYEVVEHNLNLLTKLEQQ